MTSKKQDERDGLSTLVSLRSDAEEVDWFRKGIYVSLWWDSLSLASADAREAFESSEQLLSDICATVSFAVPKLLLADVLLRSDDVDMERILKLLSEALDDDSWVRQPRWLSLWCHHLGAGFGLLLRSTPAGEARGHWRRRCLLIPWEQAGEALSLDWLHRLCASLSAVDEWDAVARLVERMSGRFGGDAPLCALWRGWSAARCGDREVAVSAFATLSNAMATMHEEEKEDQLSVVDDATWCALSLYAVGHEAVTLAELCLWQVEDRTSKGFYWAALAFCVALGALPEAKQLCARLALLGETPLDWYEVYAGISLQMSGPSEAERMLEEAVEAADVGELRIDGRYAREEALAWLSLQQARIWLLSQKIGPALAAFRRDWPTAQRHLHNLLTGDVPHIWWTPRRCGLFLAAFGDGFRRLEEDGDALSCYMGALKLNPTPGLFQQAVGLLLKHRQFDDAGLLLRQGLQLFPEAHGLRYGLVLLGIRAAQWVDAKAQLDLIGQGWFEELGLLRDWFFASLQSSLGMGDVVTAFQACEVILDDILKDDELRALREDIVAQVLARCVEAPSEERERGAAAVDARLAMLMEKRREERTAFSQLLDAQERLEEEIAVLRREADQMAAVPQQAPLALLRERYPALAVTGQPVELTESGRDALASALFLWEQMSSSIHAGHHDFGPVILQLARVVEGEVNRAIIDPMVAFVLAEGGRLRSFPPTSLGGLSPEDNHLSLGDAARVLYHRLELKESDGSVTIEQNPHSRTAHAQWLQRWWDTLRSTSLDGALLQQLQQSLPRQLQVLAALRNQAGHAGERLSAGQAERAWRLVVGPKGEGGILALTRGLLAAK